MTSWQKIVVSMAVVLLLWATWMFRYDLSEPGQTISYMMDRWSGNVYFVNPTIIRRLKLEEPTPASSKSPGQAQAPANKADVQLAIDNNPTLSFWKARNHKAYDRAVDFDEELQKDPDWRDRPLNERFAKAVALTLAAMPEARRASIVSTTPPKKGELRSVGQFVESYNNQPAGIITTEGEFLTLEEFDRREAATPKR